MWSQQLISALLLLLTPVVKSQDVVGVNLGGGIVTRTDVLKYANITLDVRDMLGSTSQQDALVIYNSGSHAISGNSRLSLSQIHNELRDAEFKTLEFVFYHYGLAALDQKPDPDFATNYVTKAIKENELGFATDAVLSLILWQYAIHVLYKGVVNCDTRSQANRPEMVEIGGGGLDEFIALWIGAFQTPASIDGYSLYAWTERAGQLFGVRNPEAAANSKIKVLYQEGAVALSLSGSCSTSSSKTVGQLYKVAVQISDQMMIPLYQWLIEAIVTRDLPKAELYSRALIPHLSQCRPSQFTVLNEYLADGIQFDKDTEIIELLHESLSCFGLTCQDIGVMSSHPNSGCMDPVDTSPTLAGFTTSSDVREISKMDLDVYQMGVLAQLGAWKFLTLLYRFGRNARKPRDSENDPFELHSLQEFAMSANRKSMPFYTTFINYQKKHNQEYGDQAIMNAIEGKGKWSTRSQQQRAAMVKLTSAYQIIFLETMGLFEEAFVKCEEEDSEIGFSAEENPLDQAGALLIGYMEGKEMRGTSVDGQLLYNLANKQAFTFGSLNGQIALVNDQLEDLLYAAKGQLDALDCIKLSRTTSKMSQIMLVPLLQAMLIAAVESEGLPVNSDSESLIPLVWYKET
ncbi:hypothetical protein FisN_37Lh008 [Fistulifera solaris]|uniref:Uncharacterized protein n=1 Tax=Fistulifera solaris TaxID=1519565 RepID=A0A1Z5K0C7_FISSO|nr:hypothetical protein FisN_37Lh008 [Fistulifera solaris]|eukprot:GAX19744.1 hypothetical protein FisN_37Lh008 [Fistulifera solaris]